MCRDSHKRKLESKTVRQLRVEDGQFIIGRHKKRKSDLIECILDSIYPDLSIIQSEKDILASEEKLAKKDENAEHIWEVKSEGDNLKLRKEKDFGLNSGKKRYERNAEIGMIVAFYVNKKALFSGKIKEIHEFKFVIETLNGTRFIVPKSSVAWYKTGKRWPKGIFNELKRKEKIIDTKREKHRIFGQ